MTRIAAKRTVLLVAVPERKHDYRKVDGVIVYRSTDLLPKGGTVVATLSEPDDLTILDLTYVPTEEAVDAARKLLWDGRVSDSDLRRALANLADTMADPNAADDADELRQIAFDRILKASSEQCLALWEEATSGSAPKGLELLGQWGDLHTLHERAQWVRTLPTPKLEATVLLKLPQEQSLMIAALQALRESNRS